ncbi:hypothetical protein VNI00_017783 [Paramarasmius palmivorus]|uniref:Uncharacterized protein n=1 Tax=Paramarasmius palmivorus TaxID=297713 RepID=A0AAW0B404_9AGAR
MKFTSLVVLSLFGFASAQVNFKSLDADNEQVQQQCESQDNALVDNIDNCANAASEQPDGREQALISCMCSDEMSDTIGEALNCAVSVDGDLKNQAEKAFNNYAEQCKSSGQEVKQQDIQGNAVMGLPTWKDEQMICDEFILYRSADGTSPWRNLQKPLTEEDALSIPFKDRKYWNSSDRHV